ncbi:DUF6362 family protein [Hoeflea sp. TYP-13]|uniref:DUF6362 family protein n=1 Tax=Hoeflea sp. TYP-13 TaxID=3230023 RepID=UPI0034C619F9
MTYQAWTPKEVEYRILEAAETLMLCPPVRGPQAYGNAMPEPVRRMFQDAAPARARYRRKPAPDALDRMEEVWTWINALPDEENRKLIYAWSWFKVRRGVTVRQFGVGMGITTRTLRRKIERICSAIADDLNKKHSVQLTMAENEPRIRANHLTSKKSVKRKDNAWMSSGAKPRVDPAMPRRRLLKNR